LHHESPFLEVQLMMSLSYLQTPFFRIELLI
jgi:hypothetical protein